MCLGPDCEYEMLIYSCTQLGIEKLSGGLESIIVIMI